MALSSCINNILAGIISWRGLAAHRLAIRNEIQPAYAASINVAYQ